MRPLLKSSSVWVLPLVEAGDKVIVEQHETELHIYSFREAGRRVHAIARKYIPEGVSLSDEVIEERRRRAAGEIDDACALDARHHQRRSLEEIDVEAIVEVAVLSRPDRITLFDGDRLVIPAIVVRVGKGSAERGSFACHRMCDLR